MARTETQTTPNPVGENTPRIDAHEKVTGAAVYTDDLQFGNALLHARIKRSPHPHAFIKRIDATKARALPGVKAVVTGQDFPGYIGWHLHARYRPEVRIRWVDRLNEVAHERIPRHHNGSISGSAEDAIVRSQVQSASKASWPSAVTVGTTAASGEDRHHFGRESPGWSILSLDDFILLGTGGDDQREEYRERNS